MADRVALFIDYQNVYMCARTAYAPVDAPASAGQIHPMKLGEFLRGRPLPAGARDQRRLSEVRVYRGIPSQQRDSRAYGASRRQMAAWESAGASVSARTLNYPPTSKPREKGIDVSLAIDLVTGAVDRRFDVVILFSTDTDLIPAIEFIVARPELGVDVEVAAWTGHANRPLAVSGHHLWCHRLDAEDYTVVQDTTVYVR